MTQPRRPVLALTQGDPAGVGPEIILKAVAAKDDGRFVPLLVAERAALDAVSPDLPAPRRLTFHDAAPSRGRLEGAAAQEIHVLDPVAERRPIELGHSRAADAAGAMAALDAGIALVRGGVADALVTAPVSKASIARHGWPSFRGHTEYLAAACGLERYGRDYLMAFLAPDLQVALLTVHQPLRQAIDSISSAAVLDALRCLGRHAGGRVAVAGLNPHAGEEGLLGREDEEILAPAIEAAVAAGLDAYGPESADSLFARARQGAFDWVLALYHDQGLIAVKTAAFGLATNWTLGLPFVRTSVDHGTAFAHAGRGTADARPLENVIETTLALLEGRLPRRRSVA